MQERDHPRIYGTPDPDDQQPPAKEGLRGEQGAAKPMRSDLVHKEKMPDGDTVEIEEQSGTAYAEVTGKADGKDPGDTDPRRG
jgi:hypothetical protein